MHYAEWLTSKLAESSVSIRCVISRTSRQGYVVSNWLMTSAEEYSLAIFLPLAHASLSAREPAERRESAHDAQGRVAVGKNSAKCFDDSYRYNRGYGQGIPANLLVSLAVCRTLCPPIR